MNREHRDYRWIGREDEYLVLKYATGSSGSTIKLTTVNHHGDVVNCDLFYLSTRKNFICLDNLVIKHDTKITLNSGDRVSLCGQVVQYKSDSERTGNQISIIQLMPV